MDRPGDRCESLRELLQGKIQKDAQVADGCEYERRPSEPDDHKIVRFTWLLIPLLWGEND